jgi:hypothetical protein
MGATQPKNSMSSLPDIKPKGIRDKLAFNATKAVRFLFDIATGWKNENVTVTNIMNRVIYLETIAAVPGMVAAIIRHFRSLRTMQPDGGMLQMFLEEANNERMHLLTFVRMKDPSMFFRFMVLAGQVGFGTVFTLAIRALAKVLPQVCWIRGRGSVFYLYQDHTFY